MPVAEEFLPKKKIGYIYPLRVVDYSAYQFYQLIPRTMLVILPIDLKEFTSEHVERAFSRLEESLAMFVERQVDMIGDEHQVARVELRVDGAGSVGQNQCGCAEQPENADRKCHGRPIVAFVKVRSSGHYGNGCAANLPDYQLAGVSGRAGRRKSGDGSVFEGAACFYDVGDLGQT